MTADDADDTDVLSFIRAHPRNPRLFFGISRQRSDISFTIFERGSDTAFRESCLTEEYEKLLLVSLAAVLARAASASPAPDVTLRVTPERDYVYRLGPRELIVQVEVEARKNDDARRSPMNLAIVLDRSGSMEGAKLEKARQAAAMAVDKLGDDDIFRSSPTMTKPICSFHPSASAAGTIAKNSRRAIIASRPAAALALHAGVVLGAKQVRRFFDKERVNRVILLSDGLANVGPSSTSDLSQSGSRVA